MAPTLTTASAEAAGPATASMKNIPTVSMGLLAVSRDCFPLELSKQRRQKVIEACRARAIPVAELETIVEHESDVAPALREIAGKGINALTIY
ncbi:MAG TPA: hypothetical protein VF795_09270, partial [Desulfuromonadaceae bacterium]